MATDILERFLPNLDLLIADFKVFDHEKHLAWTGVSNELIIVNFLKIQEIQAAKSAKFDLVVRIPMIPEHTATYENLHQIGDFFAKLIPDVKIELLNYNPLAFNKYVLLDQSYLFEKGQKMFSGPQMDEYVELLCKKRSQCIS